MTAARILIFDSGVGGLSILQNIQLNCAYSVFYAADNAAFPYGTKNEKILIERIDTVLQQLQQPTQANIILLACNTASTIALPYLRERFVQPIIGVVPAIKPAATISETKVIGLLGTPGTVKRQYTQQLINDFAQDCKIISVGSSELVQLAEKKLQGHTITPEQLQPILHALSQDTLDTVILACTHFPLLKAELAAALPNVRYWVDSGNAIAQRLRYWVDKLQLANSEPPTAVAYFTQDTPESQQLAEALNCFGITTTRYL